MLYIVESSTNWYQMRTIEGHYVVSCGSDLDKIIGSIPSFMRKCRGEESNLVEIFKNINYGANKIPNSEVEKRPQEYEKWCDFMYEEIQEAIKKGIQDVSPVKRMRKLIPKEVKQVVELIEKEVKVEESIDIEGITRVPKRLFKPRILAIE